MRLKLLLLSLPLIVNVKAITVAQNDATAVPSRQFNFPDRNVAMPIRKISRPVPKSILIRPLELPSPTESVSTVEVSIATEPIQPIPKPLPPRPLIPHHIPLVWPPARPTQPSTDTEAPFVTELPATTSSTSAPLSPSSGVPSNNSPPFRLPLVPRPIPNPHFVRPITTELPPVQSTEDPRPTLPTSKPRPPVVFTKTPIPNPEPQPQPEPIPVPQPEPNPAPLPDPHHDPEPQPKPIPESYSDPIPVPDPQTDTIPQTQTIPNPEPQPWPVPHPKPNPVWQTPAPWPKPVPVPHPLPVPQPTPHPQPVPQPIPQPQPFPQPIPYPQPTHRPTTAKPFSSTTRSPYPPQPLPDEGVPVEYNCIQDGYYSVPNECDIYIECKKHSAMKYVCPDGLNFNRNALYPEYPCVYPSEVQCDSRAHSRDPRPTSQCPRQYGFFSMNDGDCSRYLMCQEGMATIMNCPPGLAFNLERNACDWPGNVPSCQPSVFQGFSCPPAPVDEYGEPYDWIYKYKYGQSCKEYVACQQGHPRLLSCDPGLAFDDASETCVDEDYVPGCSSSQYI